MSLSFFTAYFLILFSATILPGPSMLLAINHGVNHGFVRTMYSGMGNLFGNLLMALVSVMGLGALLLASGLLFNVVKWIGIAYLVYAGVRLFIDPVDSDEAQVHASANKHKGANRLFIDGFVIAIGNPKGILFFTALFPQFIRVESATLGEFSIIFVTLGLVAFGCYMLYALFGAKLSRIFRMKRVRKLANQITGSIFIGSGLALALSKK